MKKKVLYSLEVISIVCVLCSCGTSNKNVESNIIQEQSKVADNNVTQELIEGNEKNEINTVLSIISETQEQQKLTEENEEDILISTISEIEESIETEEEGNILELHNGDVFNLSDGVENELEITLNSVDFEQEVHSSSDNMFKSYFPDQEGETYIVMKLNIKNMGGNNVGYSSFEGYNQKIKVIFNDKYNYSMQQLDVESSVMSQYWSLQPLKSQEVYFLQSVPDEVIEMPYTIEFSLVDGDIICQYNGNLIE